MAYQIFRSDVTKYKTFLFYREKETDKLNCLT